MRVYTLEREQWIRRPPEETFAFFADACNLNALTPPWLEFAILTRGSIAMAAGTRIQYRLRWRGLPVRWLTEIRVWHPPFRFVDGQLRGPYDLWEHEHTFEAVAGGTVMRDHVRYALPLGPLGRLAHCGFVEADLDEIFAYRARQIALLLEFDPSHV